MSAGEYLIIGVTSRNLAPTLSRAPENSLNRGAEPGKETALVMWLWNALGRVSYRAAAWLSGQLLGLSGRVESVAVHRSVATGEVRFGRSDIDLLLTLRADRRDGLNLAALCAHLHRLRALNPALVHVEVYPPGGLADFARHDTVWANIERRTLRSLWGETPQVPELPIHPEHALRRFLLWWEILFCRVLYQKREAIHLEKACLEGWNFFAVAQGLRPHPELLRSEMKLRLAETGPHPGGRLDDPAVALRFLLTLAQLMHASRLPPLKKLTQPLPFESVTAPHCIPSRFLVLPRPDSPVPSEWQKPGLLLATPELLDLLLQCKNAFFAWSLPPELRQLGMADPGPAAFRRDSLYISSAHLLLFPGFVERVGLHPGVRLVLTRRVAEALARGELPTPASQDELARLRRTVERPLDYYRQQYDELEAERRRIVALL